MNMTALKEEINEQHFVLSDATRQQLLTDLAAINSPYDDHETHMALATKTFYSHIPVELLTTIKKFARDPAAPGFIILENLPVGDLPPTPVTGHVEDNRPEFVAEAVTMGLANLLGEPIGYKWEKDNQLIHNVVPMPGGEYTQSNQGSKVFLNYHNDMVYDDSLLYNRFNPDFLILVCVRPDPGGVAETRYVDGRDVLDQFTAEELQRLKEPRFVMASPSNYSRLMSEDGVKWSEPQPILDGGDQFPEFSLGANGVKALNDEDQALLNKVYRVCDTEGVFKGIKLKQGQALLINNRKGVHARTEFEPTGGENERWLMRANIRTDLWSMRHKMGSDYRRYA